jgi:type I restriction enzyme S subunit
MSKTRSVGDILDSKSITHKFDKDKLVFLNTSDVLEGKILIDNYMDVAAMKGQAKKTIQNGDILFSEIRPKNKRYAFVNVPNPEDYVVSTKLMVLRNKTEDVLTKYIYYFLTYEGTLNYLQMRAENRIGSFPQITFDILKELDVNVPEASVQQRIVDILSALDTKIELNQRINAELESMAKTLYDYWFVQFDFPNEQGNPYKSAGGKMVWNETLKREIPLGWEVENIEKCCEIADCLHSKKPDYEFENEQYYLLQLENIRDDGLLDLTNKYFVPKSVYKTWTSRIEVDEDDILITNAGRVAATAQVPSGIKSGIGRNITAIRPKSVSPTYLFLAFRGIDIRRQIKWNTDSGAFFSSFNVKGIKKLFILRPQGEIEKQFEKTVKAIRRKRELNNIESQTLTELRDWLLPMLMNGQVTIK